MFAGDFVLGNAAPVLAHSRNPLLGSASFMNPLALVTGSSRGIGRGIVLELARMGRHDLLINYAGNEAAARECQQLCQEASGGAVQVEIAQADISVAADRARLIDFARERFGRLDLLVNNAGVAPNVRADLLDAGEESFDRLIAINLKGPYFLTQAAAKLMIASEPLADLPRAVVNVTTPSAANCSVSAWTSSSEIWLWSITNCSTKPYC